MSTSILDTIKKLLGLDSDYTAFDVDVTIHINSSLLVLNDLGVGPSTPFSITGKTETWEDFLGEQESNYELVKTYIYLKVRLLFDPPGTSFAIDAIKAQIDEYAWRLNVRAEGSQNIVTTTP